MLKVRSLINKIGLRKAFVIFFICGIILTAFDTRLIVRQYEVETHKVNDIVRIALVTDLHSCKYGDNQIELVNAIDAQYPDIVLLGGDICDDIIPNDNTEALLKQITNKYTCYYVTGNHEYWSEDIESIYELLVSYGVNILNGSFAEVEVNKQALNICGIDDPASTVYTESGVDTITQLEALSQVSKNGNYTILMAHRPELIETYDRYNFDLVLSGHAHGGQWRIPFILNGVYAPNQGLFPKYAGGKYKVNDTQLIVSRGLAKESTRVPRIFNRPELVMVTIKPNS